MIGWYCLNKFQCNIILSQFELSPLHCWLNMEKNGVRGEIWRQNHDKFHIPWKTERWDWCQKLTWPLGTGELKKKFTIKGHNQTQPVYLFQHHCVKTSERLAMGNPLFTIFQLIKGHNSRSINDICVKNQTLSKTCFNKKKCLCPPCKKKLTYFHNEWPDYLPTFYDKHYKISSWNGLVLTSSVLLDSEIKIYIHSEICLHQILNKLNTCAIQIIIFINSYTVSIQR